MIAKNTTTTVNFFVTDDIIGLPATGQASNITATISINGATATAISDTISEKGSGWYYFTHTFGTVGNVFIEFSATNCTIEPWEDDVINMAGSAPSAADIADAVWDEDITAHIDTRNKPLGYMVFYMDYIPQNVWGYSVKYVSLSQSTIADIWSMSTCPDEDDIAAKVWGRSRSAAPTRTLTAATLSNGSLSTFDPLNDTVLIDSTQAATMVTATGFATPSDLAGLSTFNPATDRVLIDATQATTMTTATGFATPNDIPSTSDITTAIWSDKVSYADRTKGAWVVNAGRKVDDLPGMVWMVTADYGDGISNTMGQAIYNLFNDHATATNVTNAQTAIIAAMPNVSGLSTFNASTDKVTLNTTEDSTLSAIKTKVDSLNNTDVSTLATKTDLSNTQTAVISAMPSTSGLATSSDVSSAKSDIISAIPSVPTDYARSSELANLSTFDSTTDTVIIDATQLSSIATGSEITTAKEDIITAISDIDIDTSELATSTDVAVVAAMIKQLDSGVLHWSTTATTLTLFNDDNTVMKTYSLQRDIQGNIVRIDPVN